MIISVIIIIYCYHYVVPVAVIIIIIINITFIIITLCNLNVYKYTFKLQSLFSRISNTSFISIILASILSKPKDKIFPYYITRY